MKHSTEHARRTAQAKRECERKDRPYGWRVYILGHAAIYVPPDMTHPRGRLLYFGPRTGQAWVTACLLRMTPPLRGPELVVAGGTLHAPPFPAAAIAARPGLEVVPL